jgi:hypothetical protein
MILTNIDDGRELGLNDWCHRLQIALNATEVTSISPMNAIVKLWQQQHLL